MLETYSCIYVDIYCYEIIYRCLLPNIYLFYKNPHRLHYYKIILFKYTHKIYRFQKYRRK